MFRRSGYWEREKYSALFIAETKNELQAEEGEGGWVQLVELGEIVSDFWKEETANGWCAQEAFLSREE